jgi:hypothetical protein
LRIGIVRANPDHEVNVMPRPYAGTITKKTSTNELIRASKSELIRQLYARLGPEEFYGRRLDWSQVNGKATSYVRLVAHLRRVGLELSPHT